jgi:hypothetical protein
MQQRHDHERKKCCKLQKGQVVRFSWPVDVHRHHFYIQWNNTKMVDDLVDADMYDIRVSLSTVLMTTIIIIDLYIEHAHVMAME